MKEGTFGGNKYVQIVTGTMCNANCYFCFERNTPGLDEIYEEYKQIKKTMIKGSNEGIKDISFSGGEITIYKQFFRLLELTRELGYKNVVITTNGFKMSDESYSNHVLNYLNKIELSTHTIDYKLGDEIFGKKGAGKKNVGALLNILKYQRNINPSLDFTVFTTLLKKNSSDILKTMDFFVKVGVKKVILLYSIGGTDSYNIVKVTKIIEFIEKKYKGILDLRYSYIQPCVFSNNFLDNGGGEKCFMNQDRKEVISNDEKELVKFDNILFWDNIISTDKCKKCTYYKKNCYGFWKEIYETGGYNTMNEV